MKHGWPAVLNALFNHYRQIRIIVVKLNPEFSTLALEEAKASIAFLSCEGKDYYSVV